MQFMTIHEVKSLLLCLRLWSNMTLGKTEQGRFLD